MTMLSPKVKEQKLLKYKDRPNLPEGQMHQNQSVYFQIFRNSFETIFNIKHVLQNIQIL